MIHIISHLAQAPLEAVEATHHETQSGRCCAQACALLVQSGAAVEPTLASRL